jgi:chromosome partitioning protein
MLPFSDIKALCDRAERVHKAVRKEMLKPHPRKTPPRFAAKHVAELVGTTKEKLDSRLRGAKFPQGQVADGKRLRTYSLEDTRRIVQLLDAYPARPAGVPGYVLSAVNFKGGSTKTSTAFNISQGLSLRGRRVLLIDLDPQASATVLTGLMPQTELSEADTAAMLVASPMTDAKTDLSYAIRSTYWEGLDIVPAASQLNSAELILPILGATTSVAWWNILNAAIEHHRMYYDYIIIDTAPSLSYFAICAVFASDGLLMPLPPEQLDFSASLAFWQNVWEFLEAIEERKAAPGRLKHIAVLLSRVRHTEVSEMMTQFIKEAYGQYVLSTEIPASEMNAIGGITYRTVHDVVDENGVARTDSKLRQAFDRLVDLIDRQTVAARWGAQS